MPVQLITQAEYARHRGVDPTTVRDAIKSGRITLIEGKIDPVAADAQWSRNTRARVNSRQRMADEPAADAGQVQAPAPQESYEAARRRRELAEAQMAELKLAELRGELVRVAGVRTEVAKLAAGLREGLMQIPARLAPVLAAEGDAGRVHDHLVDELRQVLQQVTDHEMPARGEMEH